MKTESSLSLRFPLLQSWSEPRLFSLFRDTRGTSSDRPQYFWSNLCWKNTRLPWILEKAMAPHSSTLAWKIPWTEKPGRLQSMRSRRVGHGTRLSDFTFTSHFHALEKEMAAHSSILACRIPGTAAWWAAIYGVTQSWTRLMWLSSNSSPWVSTTLLCSPGQALWAIAMWRKPALWAMVALWVTEARMKVVRNFLLIFKISVMLLK